jgi:hypothetical protein
VDISCIRPIVEATVSAGKLVHVLAVVGSERAGPAYDDLSVSIAITGLGSFILRGEQSRPGTHRHQLCRTPRFDHALEYEAVRPAHERRFQEGRKSHLAVYFMYYNFVRIH